MTLRTCRIVADLLGTVVAGLLLLWVSTMSFGSEFSTRAAARLSAPLLGLAYGSGQRDRISVILIDQQSLDASKEQWPVSYGYYADLIEAVADYSPKLIFLDLLLVDRRADPTLAVLIATGCRIAQSGIPILIGADGAQQANRLRPELLGARTTDDRPCFLDVGVTYAADRFDRVAWTYPDREAEEDGAPGAEWAKSAAFRMYDFFEVAKSAPGRPHDMALVWGTLSSPSLPPFAAPKGNTPCTRIVRERRWEALRLVLPQATPACAFHDTTLARELHGPDAAQVERFGNRFRGRAVMVGTMLAGTGDVIVSPINGRVPGVFLHAMALDNLLVYEGEGKRAIETFHNWSSWLTMAELIACAALLTLVVQEAHQRIERRIRLLRAAFDIDRSVHAAADDHGIAHCDLHGPLRWLRAFRDGAPRGYASAKRPSHRAFGYLLGLKLLRFMVAVLAALVLMWVAHAWFGIGVLNYIEIVAAVLAAHLFHLKDFLYHPIRHGLARELHAHQREYED